MCLRSVVTIQPIYDHGFNLLDNDPDSISTMRLIEILRWNGNIFTKTCC